jgi:enamine deaminase RidA (YjgF/YER057c/UK114 family)
MSTTKKPAAQPLARYAAYKRRGDFIFFSGVIAVDPAAGKLIGGYDDIPASAYASIGKTGEFSVDFKEGPMVAQSWFVLDRIRQMIEAEGGSMADVFKLVQYFKDLRDFPLYNRVRKTFYPDDPPVSTVVEVSGMMPSPAMLIEVEATAFLPLKR